MTQLFQIDSFSHQGKRENNEDSYFPNDEIATDLNNLFLVCDGVGGHNKGEIASDLCCTQLNTYFSSEKIGVSDASTVDNAVTFLERKFDSYMKDNPESMDMASTITLLHLHEQGATVAHMGDSRVYQFRKGKMIFRTKDHSLVQELFDANVITEEEMATHRDRNRISRAMRGASIKSYKADTSVLKDLQEGDIFFMCSDGVLESFSDSELSEVFAFDDDLASLCSRIVKKCRDNSADNYTGLMVRLTPAYMATLSIPISSVKDTVKEEDSIVEELEHSEEMTETTSETPEEERIEEVETKKEEIPANKNLGDSKEESDVLEQKPEVDSKTENLESRNSEENEIPERKNAITDTSPFGKVTVEPKAEDNLKEEEGESQEDDLPSNIVNQDKKKLIMYALIVVVFAILLYLAYVFVFSSESNGKKPAQSRQNTVAMLKK